MSFFNVDKYININEMQCELACCANKLQFFSIFKLSTGICLFTFGSSFCFKVEFDIEIKSKKAVSSGCCRIVVEFNGGLWRNVNGSSMSLLHSLGTLTSLGILNSLGILTS